MFNVNLTEFSTPRTFKTSEFLMSQFMLIMTHQFLGVHSYSRPLRGIRDRSRPLSASVAPHTALYINRIIIIIKVPSFSE